MSGWKLTYDEWFADEEPLREALCTLGNGYFATRGAAEEHTANGVHYPGVYLAGGYNRVPSNIAGRIIENEDLVNWPNWLGLSFCAGEADWLDFEKSELLDFAQELDLRHGLLERRIRVRDRDGRITSLISRRLVSMAQPHLAAIEWELTPENWSGRVCIRSSIDGTVTNQGVTRYRKLNGKHLTPIDTSSFDQRCIDLVVQTNQSRIVMAQAARTTLYDGDHPVSVERRTNELEGYVDQRLFIDVEEGRTARIEKVVAIYSSRDQAITEPRLEAREAALCAGRFAQIAEAHRYAWSRLWRRFDIRIEDNSRAQMILRLHIFHLLQTVSFNSIDLDAGVPARGLHGEAYRGHIFWDELFIFPMLMLRAPEITRGLLMYRYRRLDRARANAAEAGYRGALYPWQSGSNGREETQTLHLNPRSGRWFPDNSHLQYHVNSAIAYNICLYYQATHDDEFLSFYGAEMLLEIARFWASIATFDKKRGRYEIRGVMGPDEYHDAWPGADEGGLDNNAYTNVMAAWTLAWATSALELLSEDRRNELRASLDFTNDELRRWDDISRRMFVPFHGDGIISQFEGYDRLAEFDWESYRRKYENIHRLDRILEAEGDSANHYQVAKQADALMLFYLLPEHELKRIFDRLGYQLDHEMMARNVEYYLNRTSHGSTLSRIVDAWVLARLDRERSWSLFKEALESDVGDIQGGTTAEGIHLGAMAGTVDIIQRAYLGIEMREDALHFDPRLPEEVLSVRSFVRYRGHWLSIHVTRDAFTIESHRSGIGAVARIGFRGEIREFRQGESMTFELPRETVPSADVEAVQRARSPM